MAYAQHAGTYYLAGWRWVLPITNPDRKDPPPKGWTGDRAPEPGPVQIARWADRYARHRIAVRMPPGVIGIDVDHYDKTATLPDGSTKTVAKRGDDTLREWEARLGPLPATWASTARGNGTGPGPSRTLFYRVPIGRYASTVGDAIEVLQPHHRYALVWPSTNPDAGQAVYRWYGPDGALYEQVPAVDALAALPPAWVNALGEGASSPSPSAAPAPVGQQMLAALLADDRPACADMTNAMLTAQAELEAAAVGSRHDAATKRVYHIITLGAYGHAGAGTALADVETLWAQLTAGEGREHEWERLCLSAACKAATEVAGGAPVPVDPCTLASTWSPPMPTLSTEDDGMSELEIMPAAPPVQWSLRAHIGVTAFDPQVMLDQGLADAVLERMWPVLRYAPDAGVWLIREPHQWRAAGEMADWAISEVADLMPHGDSDKEAAQRDKDRATRRARFCMSGPSAGIARKMAARVKVAGHPCSVLLTQLDADPEILWAGGLPWALRNSRQRPHMAGLDVGTPHLESAGVSPSGHGLEHPTPAWDGLIAAIWPDEAIREYGLLVLSVGLTGYSDAVLPILLGETGRGKTSLIALLMSILGSYAHTADSRLLTSADSSHASIVYALKGKRLSFIDEGPREGRLGTERLKQLTGGGELTGNAMRRDPITFKPTHTLILTANDAPTFGDPALRRRVRLLPCEGDPQEVATARAAINPAVWQQEAPGVLAVMMHRAALVLADRTIISQEAAPPKIRYRAEEIAAEQDPVAGWIDAEMERWEPGTQAAELWRSYALWARDLRLPIPTQTGFGRSLNQLGYPPRHTGTGRLRPLRRRFSPGAQPHLPPPVTGTYVAEPETSTQPEAPTQPETSTNESADAEINSDRGNADTETHALGMEHASAEFVHPIGDQTTSSSEDLHEQSNKGSCEDQTHDMSASQVQTTQPQTGMTQDNEVTGVGGQGLLITPPVTPSDQPLYSNFDGLMGLDVNQQEVENTHNIELHQGNRDLSHHPVIGPYSPRPVEQSGLVDDSSSMILPGGSQAALGQLGDPTAARAEDLEGQLVVAQAELETVIAALPGQRSALRRATKAGGPDEAQAALDAALARRDELKVNVKALGKAIAVAEVAGEPVALPAVKRRGFGIASLAGGLAEACATVREVMWRRAGVLTVDIETTGYPIGHLLHRVRTCQLGDLLTVVVFAMADVRQADAVTELLAEATTLKAYSATADLAPLAAMGVLDYAQAWTRTHDVVIDAQLANPVGTHSDAAGLKQQSEANLGAFALSPAADKARAELFKRAGWLTDTEITTEVSRNGWAQVPPDCTTMADYAASDVLDTDALSFRLPKPHPAVLARERAIQAAVARVPLVGIKLDRPHIEAMLDSYRPQEARLAARLRQLPQIDNPGSNDQVAAALIALGAQVGEAPGMLRISPKTKKPSVAKHLLKGLPQDGALGEVARDVLAYRKAYKAVHTYLEPYHHLTVYGDGRTRPTIYTLEANTGRMSCVRPNLQNVFRTGGIRECHMADDVPYELLTQISGLSADKWVFINADLSGVEVAVLAALSQDPVLLDMLAQGIKLHKVIAKHVYGDDFDDKRNPNEYSYIKNGVFGRFYGAGTPKIAETVGCAEAIAISMCDVLDGTIPHAREWGRRWQRAIQSGTTSYQLYSGRVLHLPPQFPHKVVNYLIQGTAREIFVDGLLRFTQTQWGRCLILPIHDEMLILVPKADAVAATQALIECMRSELYGVPIYAAVKEGFPADHWLGGDSPLAQAA